jgi:hypothetical protein
MRKFFLENYKHAVGKDYFLMSSTFIIIFKCKPVAGFRLIKRVVIKFMGRENKLFIFPYLCIISRKYRLINFQAPVDFLPIHNIYLSLKPVQHVCPLQLFLHFPIPQFYQHFLQYSIYVLQQIPFYL